jgi:hypothetical protein
MNESQNVATGFPDDRGEARGVVCRVTAARQRGGQPR